MAAEIEAVAVELDGLGEAADDPVGLEHGPSGAAGGQRVGGGETCRSSAENGNAGRLPCPGVQRWPQGYESTEGSSRARLDIGADSIGEIGVAGERSGLQKQAPAAETLQQGMVVT